MKHRMPTQPQTGAHSAQISSETERALRDFVCTAVSRLSESLKDQVPEWEFDSRWERGPNGHFREHTKRTRKLWPALRDEWLRSLPDYHRCVEHLKSDAVVGPHLDRLVGTAIGASRLEADYILWSLIYAILNDEETFAFTDERFERKWRELVEFFGAERITFKMVAPLPHLVIPDFPLRLNNELVLDRLTEDEVSRCCQVGVLRPQSPRFQLIDAGVAVGIRKTMFLPKLTQTDDEPRERPDAADEGSFGSRPLLRDELVVDDVLSALRLLKHTQVHTAGHASWTDAPWLDAGTHFRVLWQWPYGGQYELSTDEVLQFLDLWHLLEGGATRFGFSIHRFNLAFDRGLLADRIVDLVIAAESLFLGDLDVQDRGELRFRFALCAAKIIEHPSYGEHDVFRVMRRAYDARSAIVHGGSPKDTRLPDNPSAKLPTFIDAIEELVRLGLRKGLSMKEDGKKLRQAEYWDALVFSKPNP
jgi:Apea-like HEPN